MNGTDNSEAILAAKGDQAKVQAEPAKPQDERKMIAQLLITAFEDGSVNVTGAISNKALSFGLLEVAKDIIRAHVDEAQKQRIATPQNPGFFRTLLDRKKHTSAIR